MEIINYTTDYFDRWNRFVELSNNGTLFHKLDFLSYHGDQFKESEHNLIWLDGEEIVALMPMSLLNIDGNLIAKSPHGSSYGGIIFLKDINYAEAEEIFSELKLYCAKLSINELIITNTPTIYHSEQCEYFDFIFLINKGQLINADLTAYVKINNDFENNYSRSCKKAIRQAIKFDLRFEKNNDLDSFYEILLKNREKHEAKPIHTKSDLEYLLNNLNEQIHLFMVYKDDTPIAGSVVFICNNDVIIDFYWAHLEQYSHLRPINYLVFKICNWALEHNFKIFDFGTHTLNMKPNHGGTKFKESFGSRGVLRKTYKFNF